MPKSIHQQTRRSRRYFLGLVGNLVTHSVAASLGWTAYFASKGAGEARAEMAAAASGSTNSKLSKALFEKSPFVYISPLLANGQESTCHAELWFAWLDDSVVVTVSRDRWKASALAKGHDRARVWVGDHGVWKGWFGSRDEAFRKAPHFDAHVERINDPGAIERLLAVYEEKYPAEIANWRDGMRSGAADGSRVMLRYRLPS